MEELEKKHFPWCNQKSIFEKSEQMKLINQNQNTHSFSVLSKDGWKCFGHGITMVQQLAHVSYNIHLGYL